MNKKYYITTLEDSDVKAYCIMSEDGYVMECEQTRDDKKFYEDVERLSKYYNCEELIEPTIIGEKRIEKLKLATIPNIETVLINQLNTEKGKRIVMDYINSVNAFDYELLDELTNFRRVKRNKKQKKK